MIADLERLLDHLSHPLGGWSRPLHGSLRLLARARQASALAALGSVWVEPWCWLVAQDFHSLCFGFFEPLAHSALAHFWCHGNLFLFPFLLIPPCIDTPLVFFRS